MYRVEIQAYANGSTPASAWGMYARTLLGAKRLGTQCLKKMPNVHCMAIFYNGKRIGFKSRAMHRWRMVSDFYA